MPCVLQKGFRQGTSQAEILLHPAGLNANYPVRFNGGIAQLVERLVRNEKARGSNPLTSKMLDAEALTPMDLQYQ
jgi:hypothetical protein